MRVTRAIKALPPCPVCEFEIWENRKTTQLTARQKASRRHDFVTTFTYDDDASLTARWTPSKKALDTSSWNLHSFNGLAPEDVQPADVFVSSTNSLTEIHYDHGNNVVSRPFGDCQKLFLLWPPTIENIALLPMYAKERWFGTTGLNWHQRGPRH